MNIKFIKSNEKRRLASELSEKYGVTDIPYLLIESGKEKVRAFSGHLSKEEITELNNTVNLEVMGLYFLRKEHDLRLSLDAPHLLKDQITKGIIEISEDQLRDWIRGHDLHIERPSGTYLIKFKEDFIGSGKSNGKKILNHIPKDRRLKK